jgi:thiol-disulfide isomerase/thioredoxin
MKRVTFVLTLLLLGACDATAADPVAPPKGILALDPAPAPALRVTDMDGARFDLDDARGRWVFVHFWASWCGPCRKEMPSIERMAGQLVGALEVVLINTAEDEDTLFTFLAEVAPELHSYMDRDGLVTEDWKPRGLPATYLVDPEGRVRYQALGGRPWDESVYLGFLRRLVTK